MLKLIIGFVMSFSFVFGLTAQQVETEQIAQTSKTVNEYMPVLGSNFAYGFGDNISASVSHLTVENLELTSIFLHFGLGNNFSLSVGSGNLDFYNPELIYLTPELSVSLSLSLTLGIQLRTVFPDDFGDFAMAPTGLLSLGNPLKNITFGYSPIFDGDEFHTMGLLDLNYINGSLKIEGRMPITNELALISKNDIVIDDANSYIGRAGLEYRGTNLSFYTMAHYFKFSGFGFSDSKTNLLAGVSFAF